MLSTLQQDATPWAIALTALTLLGQIVGLLFVTRLLVQGGSPASTLLWVVVILAAPWIGLFLYYLFPRQLQMRRLRRLRRRGGEWRDRRAARFKNVKPGGVRHGLLRLLDGPEQENVTDGNRVDWLATGREFVETAREAIENANRFVHFEVYIFRPDGAGLRALELLTAAAKRGVEVRLLCDSFGSLGLKNAHLAPLRAAGGKVQMFLPLLWKRRPFTVNLRNHRKVLVVDGEIAFTGGRNIGDEYATDRVGNVRAWQDAMVRIRGPAVTTLHRVFAEDWFNATEEELTDTKYFQAVPACGEDVVGVVTSGPDRDEPNLWFVFFHALNIATKSIDLSSPYLVPPSRLLFALRVAAARGVRVRIFTNGREAEAPVLYHAQRSYYRDLIAAGVELYETCEDYNHAKALVVDGRLVAVGSANLDLRSVHLNFEVAVFMPESPELAQTVLEDFEHRGLRCRPIREADLEQNRFVRIVDGACRLLSPVL